MTNLANEIGALRARIENLHLDMIELREDVKQLNAQVSMGKGAIRFVGIAGSLILALTTIVAWFGQNFKSLTQ